MRRPFSFLIASGAIKSEPSGSSIKIFTDPITLFTKAAPPADAGLDSSRLYFQSPLEELLNILTHGLGLVLSIGGLALLVTLSGIHGTAWHIVSSSIYGTSLVLVFAASTCFHAAPYPEAKRRLRVAEQALIFVLIAGTYTPFTLVALDAGWGWSLFGLVWSLALAGIILNTFHFRRQVYRHASLLVALYLGLGWLGLVSLYPLKDSLALGGLTWLVLGGIAYSVGVVFLSWRKLPLNHAIWHVFVLAGSLCHYFAVLFYVLPQ